MVTAKVNLSQERAKFGLLVDTPTALKQWNRKSVLRTVWKERKHGWDSSSLTNADRAGAQWMRTQKAALNEMSGIAGGYLTPPEFSSELINVLKVHSILWDRATVVPMTSAVKTVPVPDWTPPNVGSGSPPAPPWFGGIVFSCSPQQGGTTLAETEPQFGSLELRPCDIIGQAVWSNQFVADLDDAGEEQVLELFGRAAAWAADYLFLNGLGANNMQPLGILKSPALKTVTRTTSGHISQADVSKVAAGLIPSGWTNAIWACSPTALEEVTKITAYQGNQPDLPGPGRVGSIYGRPLYVTDSLPPIGTPGDLLLLDPTLYIIGDRQQCIIDAATETLFTSMQTVFRIWLRVDGKPAPSGVLTMTDGNTTCGAFVALAA